VVGWENPNHKARRGRGKSDPIDAHLAVLTALRLDADRLPTPRSDGDREALRILLGARRELTTTSTAQTNRLRALLLAGDDNDRDRARGALSATTLAGLARRRLLREAARALAANRAHLQAILDDLAPGLSDRRGIGPVTAAQALVAFSHPGRCRNEAAFAALAGTSPLPASSGRTVRHRLNRGGDRALNRAIHTIVVTRARCCPTTRAYIARRRAEGKTDKEIRRCLKRYVARQLYRALTTAMNINNSKAPAA
jgi:transposase